MNEHNLVSLSGILVMMIVGVVLSTNRMNMNWRAICWGVALQMLFAWFVFRVPAGRVFFVVLNDAVVKVLGAASYGSEFVFGQLAVAPGRSGVTGVGASMGFFLAFQVFPAVIFFSALMSVLYYFRVMPALIRGFAWVFTRLMRISGAESLCTASNIFVGVESALTIRPHLEDMTRSELCLVLTAGMATIASSVMAAYVQILQGTFPNIAGHLISASILSAPAAVVMSKIMVPEDGVPKTLGTNVKPHYERDENLFMAIISGANAGLRLVGGIMAMLLAVLGLVGLLNMGLGVLGSRVNPALGLSGQWSLEGLLGYVFLPFTLAMGVPVDDAGIVAELVGKRMILTELPSYMGLQAAVAEIEPRSAVIAAYALCGFAHLASLAIFIGGTAAIAPRTAKTLSSVGLRALVAATLACLMTACVAGVFCTGGDSFLLTGAAGK